MTSESRQVPSHDHVWAFSDDDKLAINWMTGSQLKGLFWGRIHANTGVFVRLLTASVLSMHSNTGVFVRLLTASVLSMHSNTVVFVRLLTASVLSMHSNTGVFVRLLTASVLSMHSNAQTCVVCRTVLM